MNVLLWSSLFCLSFTWLFTLNLYTRERSEWWLVLLVLGVVLPVVALRKKVTFPSPDRNYLLLVVPLILLLLVLPFPYQLGVALAMVGILSLALLPLGSSLSFQPLSQKEKTCSSQPWWLSPHCA